MKYNSQTISRNSNYLLNTTIMAGALILTLGVQSAFSQPLVYVPLGNDNKIVVVDGATDKIVNTIEGLTAVHGLARTPDGKYLIAGSYDEREAGSTMPDKPKSVSKKDHVVHHKANSAKSDSEDNMVSTVTILRTSDGSVVRRIDVPGSVHHVSVSPDGEWAAVTHPGNDSISAINLATYEVVTTTSTGSLPNYTVFSPDSKRLYVSNEGSDTISQIDTNKWTVDRNIKAGVSPGHIVMSPDGKKIYAASADDGIVSEISTGDGSISRTFDIGDILHGLDLSKDGKTLFVSARGLDKLVAIDLATAKQTQTALAPEPYHLATLGSTGKLYVSSAGKPDIWVIDQKSLAVTGKIKVGGRGHQMVLSPGS
ncbi:MAG: beta-propeller fold lactonase family protein [Rhizobiaceae bacterium]|nr:beta-propeller fold lactonase family protein [Rhizobiaceae bacterium]